VSEARNHPGQLVSDGSGPPLADQLPVTAAAWSQAHAAAAGAAVRLAEVDNLAALSAVQELFDRIWRPASRPPIGLELLRALRKAGNYVGGAYDGERLVGACVGFFSAPADSALHSHIAGVAPGLTGRRVGYALKLHQRAWALSHVTSAIEWTFDPLVARNAYFNLVKLAGQPTEYLTNFYGGMHDGINGDDDTDRLLVHWELTAPAVTAACSGHWQLTDAESLRRRGAVVGLARDEDGGPRPGRIGRSAVTLLAVPPDIETLRLRDPGRARQWRLAIRETLAGLLAEGGRIRGFDRAGWYVVEPAGSDGLTPRDRDLATADTGRESTDDEAARR